MLRYSVPWDPLCSSYIRSVWSEQLLFQLSLSS